MENKFIQINHTNLDYLFNPESIAILGVSEDAPSYSSGKSYRQSLIDFGYKGKIYSVNPRGGRISGEKIYQKITDIPDRVEYVISAIPAKYTPELVAECADKGVKAIHIFSSGFSEVEDQNGAQLEAKVLNIAGENGIRILGPNCMGIYCPETGLSFTPDWPNQHGLSKKKRPPGFYFSKWCQHLLLYP